MYTSLILSMENEKCNKCDGKFKKKKKKKASDFTLQYISDVLNINKTNTSLLP